MMPNFPHNFCGPQEMFTPTNTSTNHSIFAHSIITTTNYLAVMVYQLTNVLSRWCNGGLGQVLATLSIPLILWFILSRRDRPTKGKDPRPLPGPRGLPVVGYLPFLGSDLRWTFKDLAQIYGPIFKVQLGTKECVVVTSPSYAKEVLKDQDVIFANRDPTISAKLASFGGSEVAFADYGPEWRKMKKIFVSEMLSSAKIDASNSLRKQEVKNMISKAYNKVGELVDIGELTFYTIFDAIMTMVWGDTMKGVDGDAMNTEFRSVVAEFMLYLGKPNISDYLPYLAWLDLQGIKGNMKLVADRIEKFFDIAIEHHNNAVESNSQKGFLGYLLQLTKLEDPASSLSLAQVKGILVDAIVGGMDTTASTVEWVMAELLNHPEIMKTVQQELAEIVGLNNTVEEIHVPKFKYLISVLKESLRLHPPVALLVPHRLSMATTIGDYTIPKNSVTFINAWAIHRDPAVWEHPLEFRPERFLNGSEDLDFYGNKLQFIPFGSGRRMCPGIPLAEKMSMFVLSSLLHSFDWALPDGTENTDMTETFGITVKKIKPTLAVPSPRLSRLELYSDE